MTLIELMTAVLISVIVLLGLGLIHSSRAQQAQRSRNLVQPEAELALAHMARQLSEADRVRLQNGGASIQLRRLQRVLCSAVTPGWPGCLDTAANYVWGQYVYNAAAGEIRYYEPGTSCAAPAMRFEGITSLQIQFIDRSPAPPGGEPVVQDNNMLQLSVAALNPPRTYRGEVEIRNSYGNTNTVCGGSGCDSGSGLASPATSPPPAPCPS
ncbi:MAG: hypothetical protein HYZ92_03000 [Candidatus Omnitrophica bacterium]|nr:hypothetical protein [Candidatus Omnitrophota bacterium]